MEGNKIIEKSAEELRKVFDARGSDKESHRGYFMSRIENISRRWEITRERFKLSDLYFSIKGRLQQC